MICDDYACRHAQPSLHMCTNITGPPLVVCAGQRLLEVWGPEWSLAYKPLTSVSSCGIIPVYKKGIPYFKSIHNIFYTNSDPPFRHGRPYDK